MNAKQETTSLLEGSIASLRVVIRLVLKEIVEQKEAHRLEVSEFGGMFVDVLADRKLMKDVAFFQVVKQELLHLDVVSVYGEEQGRLMEDVKRTLEKFLIMKGYNHLFELRRLEETIHKAYMELWEADKQSRLLEESLVSEIIADSFFNEVEMVRDAIRTGKLLVIQNAEQYQALGYKVDDARKDHSVLSNGMVIHYHFGEN